MKEMENYMMNFRYRIRTCLGKNIAQLKTQKLCLQVSAYGHFATDTLPAATLKKHWLTILVSSCIAAF